MGVGGACRARGGPEPQGCRRKRRRTRRTVWDPSTSKAVPSSRGDAESSTLATYPRKAEEPMSAWMGSHPVLLGSIGGWKPQQRCRDGSAGGSSWGLVVAGCLDGPCLWLRGPATCFMDLRHLSSHGSREQCLHGSMGLFLWREGGGPTPAPITAAGLGAKTHTHCLPHPLPIPVSPHPPLVFGASRMYPNLVP